MEEDTNKTRKFQVRSAKQTYRISSIGTRSVEATCSKHVPSIINPTPYNAECALPVIAKVDEVLLCVRVCACVCAVHCKMCIRAKLCMASESPGSVSPARFEVQPSAEVGTDERKKEE